MMNIELNLKLSIVFMMYKNDLQATHSTISVTCEVWRSIDRVRQAFAAANHQPADSVHGDASNQTLNLCIYVTLPPFEAIGCWSDFSRQ